MEYELEAGIYTKTIEFPNTTWVDELVPIV